MRRRGAPSAGERRAQRIDEAAPAMLVGDELASSHLHRVGNVLKARFPGITDALSPPLNLPFVDLFEPETGRALAEGWVLHASNLTSAKSIYDSLKHLKYGFIRYLRQRAEAGEPFPHLAEIDSAFVQEFANWADDLGVATRGSYKRTLFETMAMLKRSEVWKARLDPDLTFPKEGGRRITTPSKPSPTIDRTMYDHLWVAMGDESERLVRKYADFWLYEQEYGDLDIDIEAACESPMAMALHLARLFEGRVVPDYNTFVRLTGNYRAQVLFDAERFNEAVELILPPIEALLPAIVILAQFFALNPSVVQGLLLEKDYRFETLLGRERLRMFPEKGRSDYERQRNSVTITDAPDNPGQLIRFVENVTARVRKIDPLREHLLFVWYGKGGARSFGPSDEPFRMAFKAFQKRHGLSATDLESGDDVHIQLRQMRSSTLDRVHEITGGDLMKVKSVSNHASLATIQRNYRSARMRREGHELLGEAHQEWMRQIASGGRVWATNRPPSLDRAAATPGYRCRDPLSSPIHGERRGRLCSAYGLCPICPLHEVDRTPEGYRYLTQLLERIDQAQSEIGGVAWLGRWAAVRRVLAFRHLRSFPDDVKTASAAVSVPPLPPVE